MKSYYSLTMLHKMNKRTYCTCIAILYLLLWWCYALFPFMFLFWYISIGMGVIAKICTIKKWESISHFTLNVNKKTYLLANYTYQPHVPVISECNILYIIRISDCSRVKIARMECLITWKQTAEYSNLP